MAPNDVTTRESALDRRHRVVLWTLAISRPQPATVDRIAEVLWSGPQPVTRDKVVQGSISKLRKIYGSEAIRTGEGGYRLSGSVVTAADQFERQVVRARQMLTLGQADRAVYVLAEALEWWAGPPYQELAHWPDAVAEQGRLTEVSQQAEELYIEALLAAGKAADALPLARRYATAQPLREARWLVWAKAAYHAGYQSDALQVLRDCRDTLRDELGVDPSNELGALEMAVLRQDLAPPPRRAGSRQTCPWLGLNAYDQSDADDFFGRDGDVERGLHVLDETGVLAVAGPSGVGKSSFVRAGLAAALVRAGRSVHVTTPQLGLPEYPVDVVVLDQAEELFALGDAGELVERLEGVHVILSIRSDRLAEASGIPSVARLIERGLFLLAGIGAEGLREAVEQPALQSGLVLEPGLVDLLLRDVENEPAALPMFSHALVETWRRREGQTLTIDGYLAAGGVRGAIAQTAESVHAALDPSRHHQLRSLMLRMVRTDDEGETSRARVLRNRIAVADDLAEKLVAARLLTSDGEALTLTHEALITAWPRFRDWLADDAEGRRHWQHLAQAAASWDDMGRPDSELYRGARLERAVAWSATTELALSETEQDFLAASRHAHLAEQERERRELDRQRRVNRRLRGLSAGLAAVTALAVLAGMLAIDQQRRAVTEARASAAAELEADAHRVAALSLNTEDAQLSLLLAVAAERLAPGSVTDRSLSAALAARSELIATASPIADAQEPASGLGDLASSGARVYGLDARHVLHVFTTGLRRLGTVDLGNGSTNSAPPRLAATPSLVAAAAGPGQEPAIVVLDTRTLKPEPITLERLPLRDVRVDSLDLSADARTLTAALGTRGEDVVMTWRLPGGRLLGPPIRARNRTTVRLSEDGRRLFTSQPMNAYDVASGRLLWQAQQAGAIDVYGGVVAAAVRDSSAVRILDAMTGRTVRTLVGNQGPARDLAFSPNGASVAANVGGGTVTVWNAATGRIEHSLRTGARRGIAYSAFSDTLFTGGSRLGSLMAWDLQGRRSFLTRIALDGFQPLTEGKVSVSPTGAWVSMSSTIRESPELRLGRPRPDSEIQVIDPSPDWHGVGTWSPDGSRYVYADGGGFLTVVNPADGSSLLRRQVAAQPIVDVTYADSDLLVALLAADQLVVIDAHTLDVKARVAVPAVSSKVTAAAGVALVTSAEAARSASARAAVTRWHLVDLDDGTVVAHGDVEVGNASVVSLSPDGTRMAVGGEEGDVAIVEVPSQELVGSINEGSGVRVSALAWSSDGSRLVANIGSGLRLSDAHRGIEIAQVELPVGELSSTAGFADDGTITVATPAGNVYRWNPSADAAADFACRVAGRDLSPVEWRDAFGDRPAQSVCS